MEKFEVGDVVLVFFPFSNLKGQKLRPALVLAKSEFNNLILCQITSKPYSSKNAIKLVAKDFENGSLPIISYARPDKIFTSEPSIIEKVSGKLTSNKRKVILDSVRKIFK